MAQETKRKSPFEIANLLGWGTLFWGPGAIFWLWSAYQVYAYGWDAGGHNIQELLNAWTRWPYRQGYGVAGTLFVGLLHLVVSLFLWASTLCTAPIAAAVFLGLWAAKKGFLALLAWAKTSVVGAVVMSLLALSLAYLVFHRSGAAGGLWRAFEQAVGSLFGRRTTRRTTRSARRQMMSSEPQGDRTEAALRASMESLQGEIQGLGITIPAVPGKVTLWGGWIESVSARVHMERQTKVATSVLACLTVVNDCYRQWKDYQQLRQDVEHIEETKKLRDMQRQIDRQDLERKLNLESQVKQRELENRLKELDREKEKLEGQIRAARAQATAKPETATGRILRESSERIQSLDALRKWRDDEVKKHPDSIDDIDAIAESRRIEILERSRS